METNATDTTEHAAPPVAETEAPAPQKGATETARAKVEKPAKGAAEKPAPQADGTDRLAELEARLSELEAENRALSLDRAWNARASAEGIAHPALIGKWRPADESGIDAAMDDLKAFLDGFRKQQAATANAHRPVLGGGTETAARAPKEPSANARAALDGFRMDSQRAAG